MTIPAAPNEAASTHSVPPPARRSHTPRRIAIVLIGAIAIIVALYFAGVFEVRPHVAIVTASQDPYWDLVVKGARDAAEKSNVQLTVIRSPGDEDEQNRAVEKLLAQKKLDGLAISPINPQHQFQLLADAAAKTKLITLDSDSPVVNRLVYIGADNYTAGRMCGQQVRQAVPDGGEVIISVGTLYKENGRLRRQGVIDELLERSFEPSRGGLDEGTQPLKGAKYTVVATLIDDLNAGRASDLVAQAAKEHSNLKCIVGLFAYSTPAVLKGLEKAGKLGQIKVVGFDINEPTLRGIENGQVASSIMQDQYGYGFHAVRMLADAARGNLTALPTFQMHYIGCTTVNKDNVAEIRKSLAPGAPAAAASGAPAAATQPATQSARAQ